MAFYFEEQDGTVVNRITGSQADGDDVQIGNLLLDNRFNAPSFKCGVIRDFIRLGLLDEDEHTVVNGITGSQAGGDDVHIGNLLLDDDNRLNVPTFNCEVIRDGLPNEDEHTAQAYFCSFDKMTPLHIATIQGHVDAVRNLIDHGAEVHAKDSHGYTALHIAAQKGDYRCLKLLIEAGSDKFAAIGMSCKGAAFDRLGASALITAFQHNHIDCVQELLDYGVDSNAVDENGRYLRQVVAEKAISICMPTFLKTNSNIFYIGGKPFTRFSLDNWILHCAYKLLLIGKGDHDIKSNGISEIFKWICTGIEAFDGEIFKVFVLESYCIDRNIPRGLTTLRQFGSEYYNSKIAAILITFGDRIMKEKILNMNLIQYLLDINSWFETLKFLLKCIPWVPHIHSLIPLHCGNKQYENSNDENFVLPPNVAFALECGQACMYVAIYDREKELTDLELMYSDIVKSTPKYGRYPLKQPLIDLIDERISDEIDQLNLIMRDRLCINIFTAYKPCIHRYYQSQLWNLKRYLWYEKIASNPPTLVQCCRYSLLKCLGPLNVENIRKLPLPKELQSYLLFQ